MTTASSAELQDRLDFAVNAAEQAGVFIMSHFQSPELAVERKRDSTPVTEADQGAERLIRKLIAEKYPNDAVLGEEYGESDGSSGWRWILDPVDGTKSFIHGVPMFGTLIGLEFEDRQVAGVCRLPALDEVVYAATGLGAYWKTGDGDPLPAKVSTVTNLADATFCTTTIQGWRRVGRQNAFETLCESTGISRGWGDCYGHVLVATGRADVMIDPLLNPWDCAPLVPIMQEAGGHFVDFDGKVSIHSNNGMSINAGLLPDVLAILGDGN